jgi:hypothetical protein
MALLMWIIKSSFSNLNAKKMSRYFIYLFISVGFLWACSNPNDAVGEAKNETRASLKANIKEMEDSLKTITGSKASPTAVNLSQIELINRLTRYYRLYPSDNFAAECLFKIQMIYSGLSAHRNSIAYGDTLLKAFPNYENKFLVIESNIAAYDVFLEPRDTAQIHRYYNMLLKDPNYSKSKKKEIIRRLRFLHLNIFDYAARTNAHIGK